MASYKVPQDVEAEDKFLGPLTFKQFLFGGGFVISGFIMFRLITGGVPYLSVIFLPFFLVFGALAFPWGKDQPTEIWLAGRFRYMFFPRTRIWDQSGVKDLVTVTAPKREEKLYSDGLRQDEVKSRLTALADVVDSRGWALKNHISKRPDSDRLVRGSSVNSTKSKDSSVGLQDVFDEKKSPLAGQFDSLIKKSEDTRRQATLNMINDALHDEEVSSITSTGPELPRVADDIPRKKTKKTAEWYQNQPKPETSDQLTNMKKNPVAPTTNTPRKNNSAGETNKKDTTTRDEQAFLDKAHLKQNQEVKTAPARNKVIQPLSSSSKTKSDDSSSKNDVSVKTSKASQKAKAASPAPVDPGILTLAHNDDLSVETIAHEAGKNDESKEVIIKLH